MVVVGVCVVVVVVEVDVVGRVDVVVDVAVVVIGVAVVRVLVDVVPTTGTVTPDSVLVPVDDALELWSTPPAVSDVDDEWDDDPSMADGLVIGADGAVTDGGEERSPPGRKVTSTM